MSGRGQKDGEKRKTPMCFRNCMETWVQSLGQEDPWRKEWQPTPVFLPGELHGKKSLECYSPWRQKESDTTEQLTLLFSLTNKTESLLI